MAVGIILYSYSATTLLVMVDDAKVKCTKDTTVHSVAMAKSKKCACVVDLIF